MPTYPQTGHHSRNMFSLGIFVMGLCDIILRENMIKHLYKLSNSIYTIFTLQAKWYPQMTDTNPGTLPTRTLPNANSIHRHFAHKEICCPQQSDRVGCSDRSDLYQSSQINQSTNQPTNQSILHSDNYSGYRVLKEKIQNGHQFW